MARYESFIRWAGGKSWLVPFVKELTKNLNYNNYFEPFMGGASIYFALDNPKQSFLSDINKELTNAFIAIRDNPNRVMMYLKEMVPNEENYYKIRAMEPRGKYQRAARFLFLNANSFNGIYRVNKQGKYNVPYGFKEATVDFDRLKLFSQKLQNANIQCKDFDLIRDDIHKNDLVFLDPPYTNANNTNFNKYNQKLFSMKDQKRLGDLVSYICNQEAYFILTNATDPEIVEMFSDYGRRIEKTRANTIGGAKATRGQIKELIITNIMTGGTVHE